MLEKEDITLLNDLLEQIARTEEKDYFEWCETEELTSEDYHENSGHPYAASILLLDKLRERVK